MKIPNSSVSFDSKTLILFSFERYYAPKCNSWEIFSKFFLFTCEKTKYLALFMLKNNCLFKQDDRYKTEHFRTYKLTGTGFILLIHVLTIINRVFLRFLKSMNIIAQVS